MTTHIVASGRCHLCRPPHQQSSRAEVPYAPVQRGSKGVSRTQCSRLRVPQTGLNSCAWSCVYGTDCHLRRMYAPSLLRQVFYKCHGGWRLEEGSGSHCLFLLWLLLPGMPPLVSPSQFLGILVEWSAATSSASPLSARDDDASSVQVVCAWPVSGQYGPGSRILQVLYKHSYDAAVGDRCGLTEWRADIMSW